MHKLIYILLLIFLTNNILAEKSPHGQNLKINCTDCHVTENWNKTKTGIFNHNKTKYPLVGQHKAVDCRKCHTSLEFSQAKMDCNACHKDVHQGTVGQDCARCHTSNTWIVNNVKKIHQQRGFALVGAHAVADCARCHTSASMLRFDNINTDCYACHKVQYDGTNHRADGYSTDCFTCHNMTGKNWSYSGNGFEHGFFVLTGGHRINCIQCHKTGEYKTKISADCVSCHLDKYNATKNPKHSTSGFSKDCATCHSIKSWVPATFNHEDYFPIKSGKHSGIGCATCHTNASNYSTFSCTDCHEHSKSRMDSKHDDVRNYAWVSANCYACHPKGRN